MSGLAKIEEQKQVSAVTPAQMLQIAVEQNADLDKLEKLMELQERWDATNARKSYVAAISAFRSECPAIEKTRKAHNSMYAGLAESIEAIKDVLSRHGLSHSWATDQKDGLVTVTCTVTHVEGHHESTSLSAAPDTSGSKNSIQAIGSTVSYLQRYTLYALLGLASKDQDTDGNPDTPPEVIAAIQRAPNVAELQRIFTEAWKAHPEARKELTLLKDARKKEFAND